MEKVWELNLAQRHEKILDAAKKNNYQIKRKIWKVLNSNIKFYGNDSKYLLKKIYLNIIKKGWFEVDIETKLARSGFEVLDDVINNEYKFILEQQVKIEKLERERDYYKAITEIYNEDLNEKVNKLLNTK